jgi:hypothetical protein
MTFNDLWATLVRRNPSLAKPKATVTITAANFRDALAQAYERGAEEGRRQSPDNSLFGKLFGNL